MLNVENISKLKITKTKYWAIYFTYNNEKYLLHCTYDDGDSTTLYKRIPTNDFGKYKLQSICSLIGNKIPSIQYKRKYPIKNYVSGAYSDAIIETFVWDMTWCGFFNSIYSKEILDRKDKIIELNKTIDILNKTKTQLRRR